MKFLHLRMVVDGVTIQAMFPDWYKVMNGSRVHNSETNCPNCLQAISLTVCLMAMVLNSRQEAR